MIFLTPLMVFGLSLGCETLFAANSEKSENGSPTYFIRQSEGSPSNVQSAASGVKLLEGIFQKLHNQPQLAFTPGRSQLSGAKNSSSATDQLLAIRPAERSARGLRFDYAPSAATMEGGAGGAKALVPPVPSKFYGASQKQIKPLATSIQDLASATSALQSLEQATDQTSIRNYGGKGVSASSAMSKEKIVAGDNSFNAGKRGNVVAQQPMITEYDQSSKKDFRASLTSNVSGPGSFSIDQRNRASNLLIAKAPMSSPSLNGNSSAIPANPNNEPTSDQDAATTMVPASPGLFKNIRAISNKEKFAPGPGIKEIDDRRSEFSAVSSDKKQIALLPPSIISGVPLVHLGASALQIKKSLSTKATISKQTINDWTVWSVFANKNPDCALQLYLKNGIVEAIRVFDPNFLGPDLGVKLGNDLQSIKEKFGEPAFILSEPSGNPHGEPGKNYIYPISQVSFALSRSKDKAHPAPQVVSMLIFNVK